MSFSCLFAAAIMMIITELTFALILFTHYYVCLLAKGSAAAKVAEQIFILIIVFLWNPFLILQIKNGLHNKKNHHFFYKCNMKCDTNLSFKYLVCAECSNDFYKNLVNNTYIC